MTEIQVQRYKRNQNMRDKNSPQLYYLKPVPGASRTKTLSQLAANIEQIGAMSKDDVAHVASALTRQIKAALTQGDKVKIEGLGTFHVTFNCVGSEEEKDCTVRNIRRVNIRFKVDNTLRLANDTTATTRGGDNNVKFQIVSENAATLPTEPTNLDPEGEGGEGGEGDWQDPTA